MAVTHAGGRPKDHKHTPGEVRTCVVAEPAEGARLPSGGRGLVSGRSSPTPPSTSDFSDQTKATTSSSSSWTTRPAICTRVGVCVRSACGRREASGGVPDVSAGGAHETATPPGSCGGTPFPWERGSSAPQAATLLPWQRAAFERRGGGGAASSAQMASFSLSKQPTRDTLLFLSSSTIPPPTTKIRRAKRLFRQFFFFFQFTITRMKTFWPQFLLIWKWDYLGLKNVSTCFISKGVFFFFKPGHVICQFLDCELKPTLDLGPTETPKRERPRRRPQR